MEIGLEIFPRCGDRILNGNGWVVVVGGRFLEDRVDLVWRELEVAQVAVRVLMVHAYLNDVTADPNRS
jgi:hypothetical protein